MDYLHLSDDAIETYRAAKREAAKLNHRHLGTDHLLLGLHGASQTLASRALTRLGIDATAFRAEARERIERDGGPSGHGSLTWGLEDALEAAQQSACQAGSSEVRPEDLLTGIVCTEWCAAAKRLAAQGITEHVVAIALRLTRADGRHPDHRPPLSDETSRAIVAARRHADRLGHSQIEPDHLALALLGDPENIVCALLHHIGADPKIARARLLFGLGVGVAIEDLPLRLGAEAAVVLQRAVRESVGADAAEVCPEHLLVALLDNGGGIAVPMLRGLGIHPDGLRAALLLQRRTRSARRRAV